MRVLLDLQLSKRRDGGWVRGCQGRGLAKPAVVPSCARRQLRAGFCALRDHDSSAGSGGILQVSSGHVRRVGEVPSWAADGLAGISDIIVVEVAWLPRGVDSLDIDNVVVSSVSESDASARGSQSVSSHLGWFLVSLLAKVL